MFGAAAVSPNFSQELKFDLPCKLQQLFHATLIHLMKIYFQLQYYGKRHIHFPKFDPDILMRIR